MPVSKDYYPIAGSSGQSTGYTIDQSIRFNPSDNPYLTRTQDTAASKQKFTFSWWMKLGVVDDEMVIISGGASSRWLLRFNTANQLTFRLTNGTTEKTMTSTMKFRDPASWYHCVWKADCTNNVASEYSVLYVNGEKAVMTGTQPSADTDFAGYGDGSAAAIGCLGHSLGTGDFNGYLAEMHLLDNLAYGPEYFGEFNNYGIWIPKKYTGSYNTNGFFVDGRDSSDLGDDESGNGNDFSSSGLAANDQVEDTPTNNKITFNPLNNQRDGGNPQDGNLVYDGPGTRTLISLTANIPPTGKWAVAFKLAAVSTNNGWQIGFTKATNSNFGDAAGSNEDIGASDGLNMNPSSSVLYLWNYISGSGIEPGQALTTSDEFWLAVDMANGKCHLGIYDASATAMVWVAADAGLDGDPAAGSNPSATISAMVGNSDYAFAVASKDTSNDITLMREADLSGTVPTGFTYFENVRDLI